jgi:hypothetical protein
MAWNAALSQLRDVLAGLYPTQEDAGLVVADAGLDAQHIAFSAKAVNNWQAILEEAQKQDQVEDLIVVATKRFPKNKSLLAAVDTYQESVPEPPPSPPVPRFQGMNASQKMDLVNALLQCQTVSNPQTRDAVVNSLPDEIRHRIQRNPHPLVDVMNIVTTALNFEGGLESFIERVRQFEGANAISMQEVDRVLAQVG